MLRRLSLRDEVGPLRILFVHGFDQRAEVWRQLARLLPMRSSAIDLPGHGDTPAEYDTASIPQAAALVAEAADEHTVVVGYSMGARIVLQMIAAEAPAAGFVLVGVKGPIEQDDERLRRRLADLALAESLEDGGSALMSRFVESWLAHDFNGRLPEAGKHRAERLQHRPDGLAKSLRNCGSAEQPPLPTHAAAPVLLVTGDDDLPAVIKTQERLIPLLHARHEIVRNSGHSVPFEHPERFAELLTAFVADLPH